MYGKNLGGRPDAPGEPIFTKFCMRVRVPDVFLSFEFQKDLMKNVGAVGGRNFAPPIEKAHRLPYTTACCYRISRDIHPSLAVRKVRSRDVNIAVAKNASVVWDILSVENVKVFVDCDNDQIILFCHCIEFL